MRRLLTTTALALAFTSPATAATLCVNPGGTGGCFASVQAAVDAAGASDVIQVEAGTYVENVTLPAIRNLTIEGTGAGLTVLQSTGFLAAALTAEEAGTSVTLRALTIRGAIADESRGVLLDRRVKATLVGCEIEDHDEGIIVAKGGRARLESSWVHDNRTGIFFTTNTRLELVRTTVSNNLNEGVFGQWGFSGDFQTPPRLRVEDSTISGNGGGGISRAVALIFRSTIVGNGTGISGSLTSDFDHYRLDATILSGNTVDCTQEIISKGYNFIGTACAAGFVTGSGAALDLTGDDPMLGPLQDNGGPTPTQEPLGGSPVLEAVARRNACRFPDQRLVPRLPEPCDVGACEVP